MGWCADFGTEISRGCDVAMVAGKQACTCQSCGTVCNGKFGGCPEVWAAGPRAVAPVRFRGRRTASLSPSRDATMPPLPAAIPVPAPDRVAPVLETLRHDLAAVGADLVGVRGELDEMHDAADSQAEALDESVGTLRRGLDAVADMVKRQQALLDAMAAAQATIIVDLAEQRQEMLSALAETRKAVAAEMTALQQRILADSTQRLAATEHRERIVTEQRARSLARAAESHDEEASARPRTPRLPPSPLAVSPGVQAAVQAADRGDREASR